MKKLNVFGFAVGYPSREQIVCYSLFLMGIVCSTKSFAQTCTYTINGTSAGTLANNSDLSSLNSTSDWLATGGATQAQCVAMAGGASFAGNVVIDIANNKTLTITTDLTITGNFDVTGGPGAELAMSGGHLLHVTGDLGDATNNGVTYSVPSSSDGIQVDGTLYGKNNNAFTGSGSISGGTLNVKNGSTCGSPCPVSGNFSNCTSPDAFCTTYSVPVILTSFDAQVNSQGIALNWTTESEINFYYFSLQRSGDGTSFNEIAQIIGHGTTNEANKYSYQDLDPFIGRSYYRLTSNDFDGYQETFPVVSVEYRGEKKFHVIPNPSDGTSVKLHFNFETESDGVVTIYDNLGSAVGSDPVGSGSIPFENTLKTGVYLAKYTSSSFTKTERFLVK